jgi:hypothetical protein
VSLLRRTFGCLLLSSAVSCSAASPAAASRPVPGPMPAGARWRGLYQGPYHLLLNVWTRGNRAQGSWRALGDREGAFTGTFNGNLLVIDWTERAVGNAETWSGRAYFVYGAGKAGRPDEIYGEWTMGGSGGSNGWWALKRAGEPLKDASGQIDKDADQQYQDDATGCEMGGCDLDTDTQ